MSTSSTATLDRPVALPEFDLHNVEEALKFNHALYNGTPLTAAEIEQGIQEYREFLARHKAAGMPEVFEVPSLLVDRVWHTHMAETRQYNGDTLTYFGRFFHHSANMCNSGGDDDDTEDDD